MAYLSQTSRKLSRTKLRKSIVQTISVASLLLLKGPSCFESNYRLDIFYTDFIYFIQNLVVFKFDFL